MTVVIVYDTDCPFCSDFVAMVNIRKNGYEIELVSARNSSNKFVKDIRNKGLKLNDGMVVFLEDKILYGSEAAHFLATISASPGLIHNIYKLLLRNSSFARLIYPILVFLRKLYFRIFKIALIDE